MRVFECVRIRILKHACVQSVRVRMLKHARIECVRIRILKCARVCIRILKHARVEYVYIRILKRAHVRMCAYSNIETCGCNQNKLLVCTNKLNGCTAFDV